MANIKTSSPVSIRIVIAFVQFLSSVQCATGMENERLKSVVETLKEIFKIDQSMLLDVSTSRPTVLATLFGSARDRIDELDQIMSDTEASSSSAPSAPSSSSRGSTVPVRRSMVKLFNEFHQIVSRHASLESVFGTQNQKRKSRVKKIFNEAIMVLKNDGPNPFNMKDIAEALKTLGNKAMEITNYNKSVEFYSCAIALCQNNAVYYCNRGAALLKMGKFHEAVNDCQKAISLNPGYVKAYYRLGAAYCDQGKFLDAVCEGFLRVLQLDPKNKAALVNLELAEGKLREQLAWLDDQLRILRKKGTIPSSMMPLLNRESTVLVFKAPEEHEGGSSSSGPPVLVEENAEANTNIEETVRIAEFVNLFKRCNIPPP